MEFRQWHGIMTNFLPIDKISPFGQCHTLLGTCLMHLSNKMFNPLFWKDLLSSPIICLPLGLAGRANPTTLSHFCHSCRVFFFICGRAFVYWFNQFLLLFSICRIIILYFHHCTALTWQSTAVMSPYFPSMLYSLIPETARMLFHLFLEHVTCLR